MRWTTALAGHRGLQRWTPASAIDDHAERIRTLFRGRDRVGEFLRATLAPTLVYTAEVAPTIAHSIDDVDRAMRWGFGWELGPFEIWDAISGSTPVLEAAGRPDPPALVAELKGYGASGTAPVTVRFRSGAVPPRTADLQLLRRAKEERRAAGASAGTRARASSTSATACSAWSSTRR